jgi:ATP-binding cassette subfamily B protein
MVTADPGFIASKLSSLRRQLPYLPRALRIVWQASRYWTVAWIALLVVQGLLPVAVVLLIRTLVDTLVPAIDAGGSWATVQTPLVLALVIAGLLLLGELLRAVTRWVATAQAELVQDHISGLIHDRAVNSDLAYYDSPEYHDRLHRARVDAAHRPVALLENTGALLQNGLTLVAMGAVLVPFGWWVPVSLVGSTLPALSIVLRFAVRRHDWRIRTTQDRRRSWYYDWLLTSRDTAQELRVFSLGESFMDAYQVIRARLRGESLRLARSQATAEITAAAFALAVMGAAVAWMVVRTLQGTISLGQLAMFAQAFSQGQQLLRTLLGTVAQSYTNILFLENLFEFLEVEPRVVDPAEPARLPATTAPSLRFRDVSFRYPGTERPIFDHFDLEVPGGSVTALLGVNGAGKSTLFKLLCRFYDPDSGSVELDGTDLRALRLQDLRRRITALFQEPVNYSETARRNVTLGDLETDHHDASVSRAIDAAGAGPVIERLEHGLDTLLGTWFEGGSELSVGQWRRLALARAAIRDVSVILLDEPTAAMDSWSETEWLARFRRLAAGRTTLVITHRLSTARAADVIHVIDDGRVVESGSHHELLVQGGRYAEAWRAHS